MTSLEPKKPECSDAEYAVSMCGPKSKIFSGGEVLLIATAEQFQALVEGLLARHSAAPKEAQA